MLTLILFLPCLFIFILGLSDCETSYNSLRMLKFEGKIEAVVGLLFVGVMLTLLLLFAAEKLFPNDGQIFQVVSGVITTFLGALAAKIDPRKGPPSVDHPQSVSTTTVTQEPVKAPTL